MKTKYTVAVVAVLALVATVAHAQSKPCPTCRGFRAVRCETCLGAKFGPDATVTNACFKCDKGVVVVPRMKKVEGRAGKKALYVKDGEDKVRCAACGGAGYTLSQERTYCATCNGRGSVTCKACNGTGVVR